jgi:hypothetical protein
VLLLVFLGRFLFGLVVVVGAVVAGVAALIGGGGEDAASIGSSAITRFSISSLRSCSLCSSGRFLLCRFQYTPHLLHSVLPSAPLRQRGVLSVAQLEHFVCLLFGDEGLVPIAAVDDFRLLPFDGADCSCISRDASGDVGGIVCI